jgi:hypothetical protein
MGYLLPLVCLAGCAGEDEFSETEMVDSPSSSVEAYRDGTRSWRARWDRYRDYDRGKGGSGSTGGAAGSAGSGTGGAAGSSGGLASSCEICAKAQACCDQVNTGTAPCTFDAATCSAMDGAGQAAYINACKVQIVTTQMAWASSRQSPPAECR